MNDKNQSVGGIRYELLSSEKMVKEYRINMPAEHIMNKTDAIVGAKAKEIVGEQADPNSFAAKHEAEGAKKKARKEIGESTLSEQIDSAMAMMIQKVIVLENLIISGPPKIEVEDFQRDGDLVCKVTFNLCEDIAPIDYSSLAIDALNLIISDQDIDKAAKVMQGMDAGSGAMDIESNEWKDAPEGHEIGDGDMAVVDFEGKMDGVVFEGGTGSGVQFVLGQGQFIADFENGIKGMKVGEVRDIDATFPENYHAESFSGKSAVFTVKLVNIMVSDAPSEDFKKYIAGRLREDFDVIGRLWMKKKLFDQLTEVVQIEIPPKMIEVDFKSLWNDIVPKIDKSKVNKDEIAKELMKVSERRVKLGLILANIARDNKIEVSDGDVALAKEIEIEKRPDQRQQVEEFYNDKMNYEKVKGAVLEEKVVDFIVDQGKVNTIDVTSEEFNDKYAHDLQDMPEFLKNIS